MDLVHFSEKAFDAAVLAYREFAASLGTLNVTPIPAAARSGENVMARSKKMRWFRGPSVAEYLETVVPRAAGALRIPVQRISGEGRDFRGFAGTVASGSIARGDNARIARSGLSSRVARIVAADGGDIERAKAGDAVTIVFSDHLDVSRGDLIADPERGPEVSDQFAAHVVWFEETPLLPGRSYSLRMGTQTVTATVTTLKHKVELATGAEEAGHNLAMNEIGFCNVATIEPVAFDACGDNRATGAFVLTDRLSGKTVGAGMVAFALRRASNIRHQHYEVDKQARSALKSQRPCIVWFTGLPSAGKSTVMNLVEQRLHRQGAHTYSLDGDNLRGGLTRDLGFTDADRVENIRRAGEVAKLMVDAGLVVLCAFVSPFRAERRMVRELVGEGEFVEVFVDTPIETCIERDPKGLYRKAREGKVFHVTGIDSPYEPPERPEIHLRPAAGRDAAAQADAVFAELIRRGITA
jgi:bifunctional enzyme CysN/CysC